jgi:hypothetical protein
VNAKKTSSQDATVEELSELGFNETGHVAVSFTLTSKKGFQMSGDDSVERVVFWIAGAVRLVESHGGVA